MLHQLAGLPTIVIVSIPSLFWEASCVSKRVDSPKSCAAAHIVSVDSPHNGFQPRSHATQIVLLV